jgi:hypothetical protein
LVRHSDRAEEVSMLRNFTLQLCGLIASACFATLAPGQYSAPIPYNPFTQLPGYAGNQLRNYFDQTTLRSSGSNLNQIALRNAQQAMQNAYQPSPSMPTARIGTGIGESLSGSKPFSNFSQGPAISPYLNLFRVDQNGFQGFNYSTLVQPQLQQLQVNQQQQRQNLQTTRRLQAIAAQADYNPQGTKDELPTGHQTVFQYYGHYFPQVRPHQKKKATAQ